MRRIRVLELRSVRGTGGGPEKTILLGAARADLERFDVTVCYLRDRRDPVFAVDAWARSLGVQYVEVIERQSFDPGLWPKLRTIVRERRIEIVHAHDYKTNVLAGMLARAEHVHALSTVHGWTGHSARERFLYYPLDKRVLRRFRQLIAVSGDIRAELLRCGARSDRVTVIPNGIDHRTFVRDPARTPAIRAELGIAEDTIVVGAVGRLEPQKRFDLLLESFAQLRAGTPRLRLLIAGEGSTRHVLERRIAQLGLSSACTLVGHCTDVARLHHAFDLFVQSSDYEGTPNAVLEAMALGTPIVATDVGGTSELVADGRHALVVRAGDASILAEAIRKALNDPNDTRARATRARARVENELSFERRMQRVEAIYEALLGQRAEAQKSAPGQTLGVRSRAVHGVVRTPPA